MAVDGPTFIRLFHQKLQAPPTCDLSLLRLAEQEPGGGQRSGTRSWAGELPQAGVCSHRRRRRKGMRRSCYEEGRRSRRVINMADCRERWGRVTSQPPVVSSVRKGSADSYTESSEGHRHKTINTQVGLNPAPSWMTSRSRGRRILTGGFDVDLELQTRDPSQVGMRRRYRGQ